MDKKYSIHVKINTLAILFSASLAYGQTGREIAIMVDELPSPSDLSNESTMVLTNSKGKSRTNKMISKSVDGNKKQITWFIEPRDDRGVAFLKIEHDNKDDEMRMWLPDFKKIRRISSKRRGDSFMASDLSYEDLASREIEKYLYERKEDEAGSAYYQPELQDGHWPESYTWLISMRSPNINTLMPFDKMPFSNCVRRVRSDSRANLERQKFRLNVNKIRSCQQLIQRDLAALTSIFS